MIRTYVFILGIFVTATSVAFASPQGLHSIDTNWLAKHLSDKQLVVIDMSDQTQYQRFHIPGARFLPYNALNRVNKSGVSLSTDDKTIQQILSYLGIMPESQIIIYDDMGGLNAARLYWELEKIGHKSFSILDGGLVKWILEGRPVVNKQAQYTRTSYPSFKRDQKNNIDLAKLQTSISQRKTVLLDVRSKDEYTGHPQQKRSGHIPGAKWWEWSNGVNFDNQFTLTSKQELTQQLSTLGIQNKDQDIVVYCQSGHRATHAFYSLRRLGYKNVRVYDGSMAEYSRIPSQALKPGLQP